MELSAAHNILVERDLYYPKCNFYTPFLGYTVNRIDQRSIDLIELRKQYIYQEYFNCFGADKFDLELELDAWDREYHCVLDDIDTSLISSRKLKSLVKNQYKKYDDEFRHSDVRKRMYWCDPIHVYANNGRFTQVRKKVDGILFKSVGCTVSEIINKIKSHRDYKGKHFKFHAGLFIKALKYPNSDIGYCLPDGLYVCNNRLEIS